MPGEDPKGDHKGSNAVAGPDQEPNWAARPGSETWSAQAKNDLPSREGIWNLGKWGPAATPAPITFGALSRHRGARSEPAPVAELTPFQPVAARSPASGCPRLSGAGFAPADSSLPLAAASPSGAPIRWAPAVRASQRRAMVGGRPWRRISPPPQEMSMLARGAGRDLKARRKAAAYASADAGRRNHDRRDSPPSQP
jgi:hypothetical protein